MKSDRIHAAVRAALGGAGGAALLAAWSRTFGPGIPSHAELAAAALVTGFAWWLGSFVESRNLRGRVHEFANTIDALRENPSPRVLPPPTGREDFGTELEPLTAPMERLVAAYRHALSGLVRAQEELEAYRGQPAGDRTPQGPWQAVSASRQRMVVRLAPSLHVTAATPALQQFLGRSVEDLIGRPFRDLVYPEDAPALVETLGDALEDGEAHDITFRILPAAPPDTPAAMPSASAIARRERHLQMDVMTTFSATGEPLHLRCHFVDVTDRIRTEAELRRRTEELSEVNARLRQINTDLQRLKESYSDLYHQAPVLYFSLDGHGRLVACNDTMLRVFGYARKELIGQPYTVLLQQSVRPAYEANPRAMQRPGETETRWVKRDGSVIDVWIGTTTIKDNNGQFYRSRSVARDVTERNHLANALRATADEVGRANERLRRINQELEDFTYVVSHDLKEPLRTLEAFSTFLARDYGNVLAGEGQEYLKHLIEASRRLRDLIDGLLALSRAGRVIGKPREFSWDEAIEIALGDLSGLIQRRQASVQVAGPLPAAAGDPERVVQLLTNLVSNGLKYNFSEMPEVVIGSTPAADEGFVTIFVRDNGIGIDPQYHARVFRIFRRLHRREEVEGTGAGLAICKKIVEAHGGRIWVESTAGQGASFYFTLPRLRSTGSGVIAAVGQRRPEAAGASSTRLVEHHA
jgi:PAS domain S-box-containing protein